MKQQFLNDSGLTELIGYIKKYVKDEQDVKPYASLSVFPKTGEQNIIYIDTTVNASYYWDDTSNTYKALDVQTWANLTGKPSTFPPSSHTHDDRYFTETEMNSKLAGKANSSHTHKKADITDFPTSMPASDVPAWAKASTKPTYTKAEVGLGNVDNTADKDKSVKYATSAGSAGTASSVDWSGVKNPPTTYAPSAHTHGSGDITSLSADKITGVIGIDHLPAGALERCKIVADDTARFKLTKNDIQNGDTVKVGTDANARMYFVIDDTKLSSEAGYTIYTAGSATSVPWSGVTGKPSTFTPSAHTHDDRYYTESEINSKLDGKSNTGHTHDDRYYTESEINTKLAGKSDTSHSHNLNTMINTLDEGTSTPTDDDYYIAQYVGGGTSTTTYTRRLHSALWSYIKGKADSVYQVKGNYAASSHTHTIAQISNLQTILDSKAAASHTHTIAQVSGLQSALDGKAASVHSHNYLPLSGGTLTGALNFANGIWNVVGDDVAIGDMNIGGTLGVMGKNGNTAIKLVQYGASTTNGEAAPGVAWTCTDNNASTISGTLSGTFSGSLSGNASTATNVAWSGVTGKPSTFTPSPHKHTISDITNISSASVSYATSAGSASSASSATTAGTCTGNSATATSVLDYGNTSAKINIGYSGSEISGDGIKYLAGYTTGTNGATANIKDVSKDALRSWLGLGSLAYSSATIPTIPSSLPANGGNASTVNGHTVNANVPAGAKFTDTDTWRPLGTTADTACAGNDSRLSNARPASDVYSWAKASSKPSYSWGEISGRPSSMPASDVYSWAKASSKPSYSWGEITGKPSTFTPASHTHSSVTDAGDSKTTTFAYSKANLNYSDYTWLAGWNGYELRAINKFQFAQSGHTHTIGDITNLQSTLNGKVDTSDIVNNLTSTSSTVPLSANMGRELNTKITFVNQVYKGTGLAHIYINPPDTNNDYYLIGATNGDWNACPVSIVAVSRQNSTHVVHFAGNIENGKSVRILSMWTQVKYLTFKS